MSELKTIIRKFPDTFKLRSWGEGVFRISEFKSFIDDSGNVKLIVETFSERVNDWVDFSKTVPNELRSQIVAR